MDIAIVGFGGVGRALVQLIHDKRIELGSEGINPKIKYVINSKGGTYNTKGIDLEKFILFTNENKDLNLYHEDSSTNAIFEDIFKNNDVDMVIEMTPTNLDNGEPGLSHITKSLSKGMNVVTANKGPILLAFDKLYKLSKENNVQLGIGCTTGGALPSINAGVIDLAGARITSIEGILNGTTNFILEEMENNHIEYMEALKKAQELGIAETDPTMDISGLDTATKLLILTNVLMNENKTLDDVELIGVDSIKLSDVKEIASKNKRYKLIGRSVLGEGGLKISVKPEVVDMDDLFYNVIGKAKVVRYTSDTLGDLTIIGGASGVRPAAASILRDIINIHRGKNNCSTIIKQ